MRLRSRSVVALTPLTGSENRIDGDNALATPAAPERGVRARIAGRTWSLTVTAVLTTSPISPFSSTPIAS